MELDKVGCYPFLAEPFHCDLTGRLFMGHLGNHMLNAADFHSNDRGFGLKYLQTINRAWVLSRLAIEMEEMPEMYDRFHIATWVEGAMRFFTKRNFAVTGADGKVYGYGRSIWAMIDTATRQPCDLLAVRDGSIMDYVETEKPCPIAKNSRVKTSGEMPLIRTIDTNYHDVDINGHINSVKYIEHVLDLWDADWYRNHRVHRFDIAYVSESHQGDRLHLYCDQTADNEFGVRMTKSSPHDTEEVEVVRCAVNFV